MLVRELMQIGITLKPTKLALFADDEDGNEGFAEKRLMIIICYLNKV
jgi:hypothetical protein